MINFADWRLAPKWIIQRFEIAGPDHNRLLAMEGLRGVAVLLVFIVHFASLMEPWISASGVTTIAAGLHRVGNIGVDLFFVLSGFLIYGAHVRKARPFGGFMLRRIQRLYPTFAAVLAIYVLISLILPQESKLPTDTTAAAIYVLYNAMMLPGLFDIVPIISVAWSLSYELFFYLSVPVLVSVLQLRRWDWRARIGMFIAAIFLWLAFQFPHQRMVMFACGMILADVLPHLPGGPWLSRLDYTALALAPVGLAAVWSFGSINPVIAVLCILFAVLCLSAFAHRGPLHRALSVSPLRWLGNMSYSYYLFHGLTLKAFFFAFAKLVPPTGSEGALFFLLLPVTLLSTLISSAILYLLVERPYSILVTENPSVVTSLDGAGCDPLSAEELR